jgi:hypothetical protein
MTPDDLPAGCTPAPLAPRGYAVLRRFSEAGPKAQVPWIYGPEGDVYPLGCRGDIVFVGDSAYSWDSRLVYQCASTRDMAVQIFYADDLIGVTISKELSLAIEMRLCGTQSK